MTAKSAFQEDLARYAGRIRWTDRAIWSICVYRLGRKILAIRHDMARRLLFMLFLPLSRLVETVTKNSLPVFAPIGGGLKIASSGMIFLHADAVIGRNCTIRRGVTIGNAKENGSAPTIGDDVEFGAYAQALGGIHIGDGAKIESMSVVLVDVPPKAIAIGIPARILTGPKAVAARALAL